jgi:hypothetical protein
MMNRLPCRSAREISTICLCSTVSRQASRSGELRGSVYLDSNITAFRDTLETMTGRERSACGGLGQYVLSDTFAWTIVQIEIDDDPIS